MMQILIKCHVLQCLIWIYTLSLSLSVRILKANTVFMLLIIFKLMSTALGKKGMKFFCLFVCFFYLHRKTYGYSDIKSTLAKHFLLVGRGTSNEYSHVFMQK